MHGFAVCVKEEIPFARKLSLENCGFLFSTGFHSASFFSIDHLLRLYARFLMLFDLT